MSVVDFTPSTSGYSTPRVGSTASNLEFRSSREPSPAFAHFETPEIPKNGEKWYTYICFQIPLDECGYPSIKDWNNYQKVSATVVNTADPLEMASRVYEYGSFVIQNTSGRQDMISALTSRLPAAARKFWKEYSEEMKRRLNLRVLLLDGLWYEDDGKFTVQVSGIAAE
ncbi:hypothetical protein BJ508DRAFT_301883 [Ascobolus immersus RN42]|uniref:Uncharacterized protein n=1 Tax=Ascobolus immersus RN42 TaxID=1160509 RepID=A0A3N4IQM1_ASCIM|nr:hypothetical protein BJ508DRAFT_301883 [Ascobolus immersus RN42]